MAPAAWEESKCKRAQGLNKMVRFDLCQNYFESFKYDSFLAWNKFTATTNHNDVIYIVGYIC